MAKGIYIGNSNAKKVKKIYLGDSNAHKVKKGYIGVDNVSRLFYSSGYLWKKYTIGQVNKYSYPDNFSSSNMYFSVINKLDRDMNLTKWANYVFTSTSEPGYSGGWVFSNGHELHQGNNIFGVYSNKIWLGLPTLRTDSMKSTIVFYFDFSNIGRQVNPSVTFTRYIDNGYYIFEYDISARTISYSEVISNKLGYYRVKRGQGAGSYIEDITSDMRSDYPDDGVKDGYWYVYQGEA